MVFEAVVILLIAYFWFNLKKIAKRVDVLYEVIHKRLLHDFDKQDNVHPPEQKPQTSQPLTQPIPQMPSSSSSPRIVVSHRPEPALFGNYWKRFEAVLVDHWIGIVGAAATIFGVGFIAMYAALQYGPFVRFLFMTGFASSFLVASLFIYRKYYWKQSSFLLGSVGSAIFLFACFASGGVPLLQWIDNPLHALLLLSLGMLVNLLFAFFSQEEWFYALHMLFSLLALGFAPANQLTCLVATIVTIIYLLLCLGKRWDIHHLVALSSMTCFNVAWYMKATVDGPLAVEDQVTGLISTLLIGVGMLVVHYQKIYAVGSLSLAPLSQALAVFNHIANWFFIGSGFFMFSLGFVDCTIGLLLAALLVFLLAQFASYRGIRWAYVTDFIVAQGLILAAIVSGGTNLFATQSCVWLFGALVLEIMLFYLLACYQNDDLVLLIAQWILKTAQIVGIIGIVILSMISNKIVPDEGIVSIGLFFFGLILYALYRSVDKLDNYFKILFVFLPLSTISALWNHNVSFVLTSYLTVILGYKYSVDAASGLGRIDIAYVFLLLIPFAFGIGLLAKRLSRRIDLTFVYVGGLIVYVLSCFPNVSFNSFTNALPTTVAVIQFVLVALLLIASCWVSYIPVLKRKVTAPFIYLLGAHVMFVSHWILYDISSIALGFCLLLASIVFMEIGHLAEPASSLETGNIGKHFITVGLLFVGAFVGLHLFSHLQIEGIIGLVSIRLLVQMFAFAVFAYWLMRGWGYLEAKKYWVVTYLVPLFLELMLGVVLLGVALEVPYIYLPLAFALLACVIFALGSLLRGQFHRLVFYSLPLMWNAGVYLATITSSISYPSIHCLWAIGIAVIVIQFFYFLYLARSGALKNLELTGSFNAFQPFLESINRRPSWWIFYPFFITVALFLFWRFDAGILTLAWMVEVLGIFLLGVFLSQTHFRTISLLALTFCAVRLIGFDLAQTETLLRGIVFLGFGCILLLMHTVHSYVQRGAK